MGSALGWLATHGLSLDADTQAGLIAVLTALCIALYYAAIRALERRWPAIGQWFLGAGVGKTPVYAPPDATVRVNGVTKRSGRGPGRHGRAATGEGTAPVNALDVILLLIACVCFILAAFGVAGSRVNLIALGLFAWALALLLHALGV